jgi:hypothetical protein
MGSLKDELLRKGLADDRRARQMAHDEKARRNRIGKDAVDEERRRQEEERVAHERERRDADRRRELERQKDDAARTALLGAAQMLRDHALTRGVRGPKRFHFVSRARKIPFLELSDDAARRLENGHLAICEIPGSRPEEFVVVSADTAQRLRETAPEYVLFQNKV